ncbi:MAG: hypothetical protein HN758_17945 [Verrucomicrobia bacterium]|nr:hypothetical protein [Opitutae bacterium]MBT4276066.1 hypothetical protein [Verrucomicrobiota bacterium]MBT5061326.1 hypothetical protein [Verrucomicrobiota bacterium]MBT5481122.1 hypothetical protein [Verrucomicrobiota bacterium]MBT6237475.1 hypothetical protein [Verrucomicrobiota bacterium]
MKQTVSRVLKQDSILHGFDAFNGLSRFKLIELKRSAGGIPNKPLHNWCFCYQV